MDNTVGIFLITKSNKILICHPTNASMGTWSIPKGLKEDNESDWTAGIRELYEETHIEYEDIMDNVSHIIRLDDVKYPKRSKKLTPYVIKLNYDDVINFELSCESTYFTNRDEEFPEVDVFRWVSIDDALESLHGTQTKALREYLKKWGKNKPVVN